MTSTPLKYLRMLCAFPTGSSVSGGLTKRDYFAAKYMASHDQSILHAVPDDIDGSFDVWAYRLCKDAYRMADMMLRVSDEEVELC